ncbi:hypothetical protein ALC62_02602, partial [Cyphomyrmex costatus]
NLKESKTNCLQCDVISLKDTSATSLMYSYVQPYLLAGHPTHLSCTSFQNYAKCVEIRVHSAVACTLPLYSPPPYYLRLAATSNN